MRFLKVKFKKYYSGGRARSGTPYLAQVEAINPRHDRTYKDPFETISYLKKEGLPNDTSPEMYKESIKFDIKGSSFFMPEKDHEVAIVGDFNKEKNIFEMKYMLPMYLVDDFTYDVYDLMRTDFFPCISEPEVIKMERFYGNKIINILRTRSPKQFRNDNFTINSRNDREFAMQVSKLSKYIEEFEILKKLGLNREQAASVCREYAFEKKSIVASLSKNPYSLRELVPIQTLDTYAQEIHKNKNHEARVIELIKLELENAVASGATAIPYSHVDSALTRKYGVTLPKETLTTLVEGDVDHSDGLFYSKRLRELEEQTAIDLVRFMQTKELPDLSNLMPEEDYLKDGQAKAVSRSLKKKFAVITGGPGVGKTTVTKSIINVLKKHSNRPLNIVCVAPTGKAAERMTESTGLEAKTMHSLLGSTVKGGYVGSGVGTVYADVIVVDELSMCDIYTFNKFIHSLHPNTRVIALGDKDQIPSVEPGNILKDLIDSRVINVSYLTESVRVKGDSGIGRNAKKINKGEMPELTVGSKPKDDWHVIEFNEDGVLNGKRASVEDLIADKIDHLMNNIMEKYLKVTPDRVQVLAPKYEGKIGVDALNDSLSPVFNTERKKKGGRYIKINKTIERNGERRMVDEHFYVGDRIIQNKNDKKLGLKNGSVGQIRYIDYENHQVVADFDMGKSGVRIPFKDMKHTSVSFAMTIHKSQGSEYDVVIIPISEENEEVMNRALLYTGVTRGKKHVFLIGNSSSIEKVIANENQPIRTTMFAKLLRKYFHEGIKEKDRDVGDRLRAMPL